MFSKVRMPIAIIILFASLCATGQMVQTPKEKDPESPRVQDSTVINGKQITIEYGAPSIRGRKILGELIPINKAWVTGAGAATVLKMPIDLKIGYLHVPAGTYTVYSIITEKGYELIINKQTAPGAEYDPAQDLGRTRLNTNDTDGPIEKLIIEFENTHDKKTELHIKWGYSESWLHISAD